MIQVIYLGLILGLVSSLSLSQSLWIDMRFNTSLAIPVFILGLFFAPGKVKNKVCFSVILVAQAVFALLFSCTFGFDLSAWTILPASLIRDSFFPESLNLSIINPGIAFLVILVNVSFLFPRQSTSLQ